MIKRPKIWKSLSAVALAGTASAALLVGCDNNARVEKNATAPSSGASSIAMDQGTAATGESPAPVASGEGAGEGEGAGAALSDIRSDNVAYLEQLSYVKGHLLAGVELYKANSADMGMVHMKHPQDELIAGLRPGLEARNAPSFDNELSALADAVHGHAPVSDVEAKFNAFVSAIEKSEHVQTGEVLTDPKQVIALVEKLVRTAASEYALGVQEGKVVNPKEYQDAFGFVQVAKQRVAAVQGSASGPEAEALAKVKAQLDALDPAWPSIVPPPTVQTDASQLYGAAARIQIAGLAL